MADTDAQTLVIGAGVVGLACAAALASSGRDVLVLEREAAIGQGVSSRNSEVIHAGIYYPPGSLRAQLCVDGRRRLYQYCAQRSIAAHPIGKLIVATSKAEIEILKTLMSRARRNGVDDLQMISAAEARALEPQLACEAALHSPSTGIVDSHALMLSLHGDIENAGGTLVLQTPVMAIASHGDVFIVHTGGSAPMSLSVREVVNSCGLSAVQMANAIDGLPPTSIPHARFARGNYFRLQGRAPFERLIYPAPVQGGLGVHLTLDLAGQARFGPDVEFLPDQIEETLSYAVDAARADSFYAAIRRYWPALPDHSLLPDYAGVRPKITRHDQPNMDFEISTQAEHGIRGLVNLYGIESPGLTSSLAIAERVSAVLAGAPDPQHLV